MSNDDEKNGNIDRNKLLIVGGAVLAAVAAVGAYFLFGNNNNKSGSGTSLGTEQTLAIIKPDGIQYSTQIREKIAQSGFTILQSRKITLTKEMAGLFYNEHRNKKFFEKLTDYMTSGILYIYHTLYIIQYYISYKRKFKLLKNNIVYNNIVFSK